MSVTAIIPTLNAGSSLADALAALGSVDEILIVDGGSSDDTHAIAADWNAKFLCAPRGRGQQLRAGADAAASEWFLFLHSDTRLQVEWQDEVRAFMKEPANARRAAAFTFTLDDPSPEARRLEKWVRWRVRTFGLAYGDQGLLIQRDFYRSLGGFRSLPLMEDVDFIRRIGRNRLALLQTRAVTSSAKWRRDGWLRRSALNLFCLSLYFAGIPPRHIARIYG